MKWGPWERPAGRGKIGKIASWLLFSVRRLLRSVPAALCPGRSSEAPGIHLCFILTISQVSRTLGRNAVIFT